MKTVELVRQLEGAITRLHATELLAILRDKLSPPPIGGDQAITPQVRAEFAQLLFDSNVALARLQDEPNAAEVLSAFGLFDIYTPDKLSKMMTLVNTAGAASQLRSGADGFFLFREFEVGLSNLPRVAKALDSLVIGARIASVPDSESVLELQVTDVDGRGILASRLANVLIQLKELNEAIEGILASDSVGTNELRIAYTDSGSDILLALQGHEKTLAMIGGAFAWMWTQLRFARNANFDRDLESITKGIEVLTILEQKRDEKVLDDNTANRLRTAVVTRMQKLVNNGVAPPDNQPENGIGHQQLVKEVAQRKRLTAGDQAQSED
jgi:hypothetical protein